MKYFNILFLILFSYYKRKSAIGQGVCKQSQYSDIHRT